MSNSKDKSQRCKQGQKCFVSCYQLSRYAKLTVDFFVVENCPLPSVFFLQMKEQQHQHFNRLFKRSTLSIGPQSANSRDVNHTPQISFQPQQHRDSTDKVFTEPCAIRKWINNSCISSYPSKMASRPTSLSNITHRKG